MNIMPYMKGRDELPHWQSLSLSTHVSIIGNKTIHMV